MNHRYPEIAELADFVELIPDATVASDLDGNIVLVNDEATRAFGYSREQLLTMTVFDVTPQHRHAELHVERDDFFETSQERMVGRHERHWALRSDGSEYPVELSFSRFNTAQGPLRIAAVRDISERVRSAAEREELRTRLEVSQARRMEAVGQLAGGIAHDFNNLMGVILTYADFALSELDKPEAVREDVQRINDAAERAAELVEQLLVFSRRKEEARRVLDLNTVLTSTEKLMRRALGEHIELVTRFAPDLPPILADAAQIEQAVINLAVNARDAMPDGGILEIETSSVELDAESLAGQSEPVQPGQYVRLTVADNGLGMDRDTLEHAFEPFFTTKMPEGTGLGLSTVYGTVRAHEGTVYLYSEPGSGTAVKMHFPASASPVEPVVRPEPPPRVTGDGERVLVVEDELWVREMIVRALSSNGYEVVERDHASAALELLADSSEQFDLLLTDVVMPELLGSDLAERAAELRPGMPVLYISGYSELALQHTDRDGIHVDLLEKPFSVNALLFKVNQVITEARR